MGVGQGEQRHGDIVGAPGAGLVKPPCLSSRRCAAGRKRQRSARGVDRMISTPPLARMSAVVCSDVDVALLELRSAALTLMAVVLKSTDLDALSQELTRARRRAARPVRRRAGGRRPVVRARERAAARRAGAAGAAAAPSHAAGRRARRQRRADGRGAGRRSARGARGRTSAAAARSAAAPQVIERTVEVQLAPLPPLVVDKPLRSGPAGLCARPRPDRARAGQPRRRGDGRRPRPLSMRRCAAAPIAGAAGNTQARIFCHRLEAQVLAIAGVYRTMDEPLPDGVQRGGAAMVRLDGERPGHRAARLSRREHPPIQEQRRKGPLPRWPPRSSS